VIKQHHLRQIENKMAASKTTQLAAGWFDATTFLSGVIALQIFHSVYRRFGQEL